MTDYKLMPKQITKEMADAFWEEYSKDRADDLLIRCYKALYVTAPAPQPSPDEWKQAVDTVADYAHLYSNGLGVIHEIRAEHTRLTTAHRKGAQP